MARRTKKSRGSQESAATVGCETRLWQITDALRNNVDAAGYKHVVFGLNVLGYTCDAFEAKHASMPRMARLLN